ncbi:NEW3 domain-containing protein [Streptomyces sp. NPDC057486]|uniref:NEW3 domain-containing protein n=1 Tax=Streptomyces sp. NPDC057486 TaxID=3346145 RepID=UPI0036B4F2B0
MRPTRMWSAAVRASALALTVGLVVTVPAGVAEGADTRPIGTSTFGKNAAIEISAGYLTIHLDSTGTVTGLKDSRTGADHLAHDKSAPLVSLVINGKQERPTKVTRSGSHRGLLTFTNKKVGFKIVVKVKNKAGYSTLEAVKVEGPAGADVQTLLWGPLPTSITQTIGQTVGVVRDNDFAIGLRPLTDRTEGAWPQEYQQFGWESEVEDNPSDLQVALPHGVEEWSAAGKTAWGSVLRAFTYDYTKERQRNNIDGYPIPVGPLPGDNGQVVGSKIALFGALPELTPTVLSNIATGENLPYPTQNGQWQKTAQASSQSFLVLGDLRSDTIPDAARFAKAAGIDYIYSLPNAVGPWQSTGHYQFNSSLGGSDAGAAAAVDIAKANGVRVGVHTISDFVSTNDRYVVPTPDDRLATGGRASLTRPLTPGDTTLYLDSNALLADGLHGRTLRIGDEFIEYSTAEHVGSEWVLAGVRRARWGSVASSHAAGDRAARMIVNQYGGATGGRGIIEEISTRLSDTWNSTGIMSNSYDGLESASESGWGSYGVARLVNGTYEKTRAKDGFITETSRMTSNTWDALTRASWGEVGSTSMNQVFINNKFYRDNFLPGMLGWISLHGSESLLSIEGKLARGAGLNAGAGFQSSVAGLTEGGENGKRVLDAIKQWETARNLGAFTEAQRERFRDQSTDWHLTVVKPGKEWSLQQLDAKGNPVGAAQSVVAPTPAFTTRGLPALSAGVLYEARLTTNAPGTSRYTVTSGALPAGLKLNPDTGGITGIPRSSANATFTVTAKGGPGTADAVGTFTTGTLATSPHVTLSSKNRFATRGGTVTLTASITNPGTTTMAGTTATITLPTGWTTPTTTATVGSIAPKATATASWAVNIAADAAHGPQTSSVSVAYTGGPGNTTAPLTTPVAYSNLAATFNNIGITDDSNPTPGNFDGYGNSYSAQALSAAGVKAGAALTYNNTTFTWPSAASGTNDNTTASGQIIQISGSGAKLAFLGAGIGSSSGTVTVFYTDGTTSTGTLGFPNWLTDTPTEFGAQPVITTTYRNTQSGPANHGYEYRVYYNSVQLTAGKTVEAVQLPNLSGLHTFAIGIG